MFIVPRLQKKQRRTKKTILIVGEGPTEKAFLLHIRDLYVTRDMPLAVKVQCGSGGSPQSVVEKAIRLKQHYDKCFVLVDSDVPFEPDKELQKRMKKKPRIEMLYATPCIEGLMLAILQHPKFSQTKTSSDDCKRMFDKYVPEDKKTDKRAYEGVFSKESLDAGRKDVSGLGDILKAMDF
ncbi:MAG: RloB domain-containing protein [Candidatus Omnitrophica bacterium]|nr:RloB domain-containing protein [Candidatus Omnitrophota bacterium]